MIDTSTCEWVPPKHGSVAQDIFVSVGKSDYKTCVRLGSRLYSRMDRTIYLYRRLHAVRSPISQLVDEREAT